MRFAVPAQIIGRSAWFIFVGNGQILLGGTEMLRYLENVVTLQLDTETCNGCGMCVNVCPHGVFFFRGFYFSGEKTRGGGKKKSGGPPGD